MSTKETYDRFEELDAGRALGDLSLEEVKEWKKLWEKIHFQVTNKVIKVKWEKRLELMVVVLNLEEALERVSLTTEIITTLL